MVYVPSAGWHCEVYLEDTDGANLRVPGTRKR